VRETAGESKSESERGRGRMRKRVGAHKSDIARE